MGTLQARVRLRELLGGNTCTLVAPIFNPLSANIAQQMGWEVCKLSSSVTKAVNLGLPDEIDAIVNLTDYADVVRRIRRVAPDISLSIDIDDAGGSRVHVYRTVIELEAAGISSIEIEDRIYAKRLHEDGSWRPAEASVFHSLEDQVANLKAALAARTDPNTVIIARTAAFNELQTGSDEALSKDQALERVRAYAETGVDAIMLPGIAEHVRADIEAVHTVTDLPLCVLRMPPDVVQDKRFLAANQVRLRYLGQPVFYMTTRAIYDSLKSLQDGGNGTPWAGDLDVRTWVPERSAALKQVSRWAEFVKIDSIDRQLPATAASKQVGTKRRRRR